MLLHIPTVIGVQRKYVLAVAASSSSWSGCLLLCSTFWLNILILVTSKCAANKSAECCFHFVCQSQKVFGLEISFRTHKAEKLISEQSPVWNTSQCTLAIKLLQGFPWQVDEMSWALPHPLNLCERRIKSPDYGGSLFWLSVPQCCILFQGSVGICNRH